MLDSNKHKSSQPIAKHSILKIIRHGIKVDIMKTIDILILDEAGTVQAKLLSVIDIIFRRIRGTDIPFGGVLIVFTLDHTQFAAIGDKPFLTSSHIISCFQCVELTNSVRACNDANYERVQQIARMHPTEYKEDPSLLVEYRRLITNVFTFVKTWNDKQIDPNTFRLYGKHVPAREETMRYINSVKGCLDDRNYILRDSEDVQNLLCSNTEWNPATEETSKRLDRQVKEPRTLLLFKGGIYSFTFNKRNVFSQSQLCLLIKLPSREDVHTFKPFEVLLAPGGIQDVQYDETTLLQTYIEQGWKKVRIGTAPERTRRISTDTQAQRKQYGIKHHVTSTIHASMGDTLNKVALQISCKDPHFKLWDRAQVIVATSRTKLGKDTIFVGNKQDTINALVELIQKRDQWTDYHELVLDLITINRTANNRSLQDMTLSDSFPFRIKDIPMPNCQTGFVYFLISITTPEANYIGETICLKKWLKQHNSGYGSNFTYEHRPYAVFAFICGFGRNKNLMKHVEYQWQIKRDILKNSGNMSIYDWALQGQNVIHDIDNSPLYVEYQQQLKFVLLFQNT